MAGSPVFNYYAMYVLNRYILEISIESQSDINEKG
jgi:hypothetical protein